MKKILIVDDDEDILALVGNRLKMNNYNVLTSNDGQDAYKKAVQHLPNLIIMDVMMPNMPGAEAVKLLKENNLTQNIPVFFFTALASNMPDDNEFSEINVGGKLYPAIPKPFDPNKLLSAIKSVIGQ
jgi:DNA-binding response OmpR family regulator